MDVSAVIYIVSLMPERHPVQFLAGLTALLLAPLAHAAADAPPVTRLAPVPACPALVEAAQVNHIPLQGINPASDATNLQAGDSVTALLTLHAKGRQTQWITCLQIVAPTDKESVVRWPGPATIYTSLGSKERFSPVPAYATVRTLGPFVEENSKRQPPKPKDIEARFDLNEGFLSLGLDQAAAAFYRVHQAKLAAKITRRLSFATKDSPFKPEEIAKDRPWAEQLKITPAEERAWAGINPALLSYFDLIGHTPGLEDVMYKVVDLPPLWSLVWHGGVNANLDLPSDPVTPALTTVCPLPNHPPVYFLPMRIKLNGHDALDVTLAVTAPRSPLLACGGVIGLLAQNPADKNNYLTMQIISARRGSSSL